jgi:HSP20 family protein
MALIPYEPFRHLENWKRDLDRFFNEFPLQFRGQEFGAQRIDVYETENEVVASCEIPGLEKKDDVQIHVDNNVLTISGSINKTHEVKEDQIHRQERFYGRFQRSVTLPAAVNEDEVTATYKNGVLEIRMPKIKPPEKKRIDVQFH